MSCFHNELHEFYEFLSSDVKNGGAGRQMKNLASLGMKNEESVFSV